MLLFWKKKNLNENKSNFNLNENNDISMKFYKTIIWNGN